MNGAEALLDALATAGIEACFANPGTTELALVSALDAYPSIRVVPTLFEGVATGAADGYGRMTGRPALTLMHLGPGLANGIANLHNARRARSPVLNVIGDHPAVLREKDPPLAMDIEALARTVSGWVRTTRCSTDLAADAADALAAARGYPGSVATLIVPADCQWGQAGGLSPSRTTFFPPSVAPARVESARRALSEGGPSALLLGGAALRRRGLLAAQRIASRTGCRLLAETFPARMECGQGLPAPERFPYLPEMARGRLRGVNTLVLAGAAVPVEYFADEKGAGNPLPKGVAVEELSSPTGDVAGALEALAADLGAPRSISIPTREKPARPGGGPLNINHVVVALGAALPESAILIDEGVSYGGAFLRVAPSCPPHNYLSLTGGATGQGLPCAVGAAIACPDQKVVTLVGDGSAMYTLQALWTQARENLDVLTLVCANNGYRILELEMARRHGRVGSVCRTLVDFSRNRIDWCRIAGGLGIATEVVDSVTGLVDALDRGFAERGPRLLEVCL